MSQIPEILKTLKKELKAQGLTYSQVAASLALSENSIKRLFSDEHCSLQRLEQICELAGTDMIDLIKKTETDRQRVELLSVEQEREIANDVKLLLVATCVLNRWTFEEIKDNYQIADHECIQLLVRLDQLDLIELLPLNRFKVIVANNFRWRSNGPIQKLFQNKVQPDFFNAAFTEPGAKLLFQSGMLSRGSNAAIMKKMEKLVSEFSDLHEEDTPLALEERFGTSIVLAVRAWEFGLFQSLRRKKKRNTF